MPKCLALLLLIIMTFVNQAEAATKEVKPLFGLSKFISNEADELLNQSWTELHMSGEAAKMYPKLSKAIEKYNIEEHDKAMERQRKYHEEALSLKQEMPPESFRPFYDKCDLIVRRADSTVLSLLEDTSDYMGGVHGMYGYFGVNFDTATGKRLQISDICTNAETLIGAILTRLHEDYPRSPFENAEAYIMEHVVQDTLNFTINPDGISVYFNPYEIGSYAEGLFTATLLFSEYPNLFKSKYTQSPKAYCQSLPRYGANIVSFETGKRNYIQLDIDDAGFFRIFTGAGNTEDRTGLAGIRELVLVHMVDGKNYIYVDGYIEGEGRRLHVFSVSESKIELVGVMPYTFKNLGGLKYETWWIPTNPNNIRFDSMEPIGKNNQTSHFGAIQDDGTFSFS
ncbi:MAG: DUF3298 domain-containing protein [Selenomonadaceae bacterium]|nr:DUF3298 domain-containing protein [Selenomonadaceae bacterium]